MASTEETNVTITKFLSHTLWEEYQPFLESAKDLDNESLATHEKTAELRDIIALQVLGSPIAKVKIYNLAGRTVFSTDFSQIGDDKSQSQGFLTAKSGLVESQLGHRDTFEAVNTTLKQRDFLSSYIPVYSNIDEDEIVAVFELYTDVTPLLRRIDKAQGNIVLGSALVLLVAYGILFLFVRRAENLLRSQYQQLKNSEIKHRNQSKTLETVLAELKAAQSRLVQTEKMSSLGKLVAGVAHEINNPVSFIHGNLVHLREYVQDLLGLIQVYQTSYSAPTPEVEEAADAIDLEFIQEDLNKILTSMQTGSDRICDIVLSLRTFSRLDEAELKSIDLQDSLDNTLALLNHRLKASPDRPEIIILRDYALLPLIECYPGKLNQVFMNVLANAIDALEEKAKQGKCNDGTATGSPADLSIAIQTKRIDQRWATIEITDNGIGIPSDVQSHIFDPFFTTKPIGHGTGMGMSISYSIVIEQHKGQFECVSSPDRGTTFTIRIPIVQSETPALKEDRRGRLASAGES